MNPLKSLKISETLKQTKQRRTGQVCKVYELKIDKSHLSSTTKEALKMMFIEAKWLYNHTIASNPFEIDTKIRRVQVKVDNNFEIRELKNLPSQIKQELIYRIRDSIKSLSKLKESGHKVGSLKFKSTIHTLPLKQYGRTYKILNNRYIRIQGIKQKIRVMGLEQIPEGAEIANANLISKHGDYFLKVTAYLPKEQSDTPSQAIGMDLGIKEQITFSNGIVVRYRVNNNVKRLRKLYQKLSRTQKGSNNRLKVGDKLQKEFDRINNKKRDIRNKIVSYLRRSYRVVCFQDDNIRGWQRIWGSRIFETSIGGIIGTLRERIHTPVEVSRVYPSTKLCSQCDCIKRKRIELNERLYICEFCGAVINRNYNSARNILFEGLTLLPTERREVKPVETVASTIAMLEYLNSIPHVKASLAYESGSLNDLA